MTLAVMMRASLGHTGRELQAVRLTLAFVSVALAGLLRVAVPSEPGLWLAAALWTCGFAIFVARLAPALTLPNPARRRPDGERRHQRCFAIKQRAAAVEPDGDVGGEERAGQAK